MFGLKSKPASIIVQVSGETFLELAEKLSAIRGAVGADGLLDMAGVTLLCGPETKQEQPTGLAAHRPLSPKSKRP